MKRVRVVDSHTEGEPTRVVLEGGPDLGRGSMAERRDRFQREFDRFRSAVANEPRGSDVVVGALLCPPVDPAATAGVIFFNNIGYLGMCGHGTIGLIVTLAHLGRIGPGLHRLETPVGPVTAELHDEARVTVTNVPSYRLAQDVRVEVPGHGMVAGSVAWGGNWFFLIQGHSIDIRADNLEALTAFAAGVQDALRTTGIRAPDGAEIDHVELFAPSPVAGLDSRNFVLCPGKAYDRSPCGTGTSAKLACLQAEGKLAPGQPWRQEGIVGGVFEGRYQLDPDGPGRIVAQITGRGFVTGEATLLLDERDPFCWGIRAG